MKTGTKPQIWSHRSHFYPHKRRKLTGSNTMLGSLSPNMSRILDLICRAKTKTRPGDDPKDKELVKTVESRETPLPWTPSYNEIQAA